ncbi:MAG: class I SAM-dependent methyltransferase [Roseomonas sp.]|nr:class I SAM-dependent methyltransferase [Roseomonas sp.]
MRCLLIGIIVTIMLSESESKLRMDRAQLDHKCKICGNRANFLGRVDFNKHCDEGRSSKLPISGVRVTYLRCVACEFLFTSDFDTWSQADFAEKIYNADYARVDPDFAESRPAGNASFIMQRFGDYRDQISLLDYGGGEGRMMEMLRANGFRTVNTYDPFSSKHHVSDNQKYDLITAFEVFEHVPDPAATMHDIVNRMKPESLLLFSTLLQPTNFGTFGLSWWYVGPRNGHISIHSKKSLALLLKQFGLNMASDNQGLHIGFRELPYFAEGVLK